MSPERVRPERLPRFLTRSRLSCAADPPNTHPLRLPRQLHAPVRTRRESLGSLGTHEPGKEIAFLRHMAPRRRATSGRGPANPHSPNALGPAGLPTPQSSLGPRSPNTEGKGASGLHPLADTQPAQSAFPILLTRDGGLRSPPGIRTRTSLRSNALRFTCDPAERGCQVQPLVIPRGWRRSDVGAQECGSGPRPTRSRSRRRSSHG
jgi:hypothetical protein